MARELNSFGSAFLTREFQAPKRSRPFPKKKDLEPVEGETGGGKPPSPKMRSPPVRRGPLRARRRKGKSSVVLSDAAGHYDFALWDSYDVGRGHRGKEFWPLTSRTDQATFILELAEARLAVSRSELRDEVPTPLVQFFTDSGELDNRLAPIFEDNKLRRAQILLEASKQGGDAQKYHEMHYDGEGDGAPAYWNGQIKRNWEGLVGYCNWLCATLGIHTITQMRRIVPRSLNKKLAGKALLARLKPRINFAQAEETEPSPPLPSSSPGDSSYAEMDGHRDTRCVGYWEGVHRKEPEAFMGYVAWAIAKFTLENGSLPTEGMLEKFLPTPVSNILTEKCLWEGLGLERRIRRRDPWDKFVDSAIEGGLQGRSFSGKPPRLYGEEPHPEYQAKRMLKAAARGKIGTVINYLDAGYPLHSMNGAGQTVAHLLAEAGDAFLLAQALSHEQFPELPPEAKGKRAAEKSAKREEIIQERSIVLDARDNYGTTPLMCAVASGSLDSTQLLIGEGAKLDEQRRDGRTALILAVLAEENSRELVSMLLKAGADPTIRDGGLTWEDYRKNRHPGDEPIKKADCTKIGKTYYVDPPLGAVGYARLLENGRLASKLESAERKWKKAHEK